MTLPATTEQSVYAGGGDSLSLVDADVGPSPPPFAPPLAPPRRRRPAQAQDVRSREFPAFPP